MKTMEPKENERIRQENSPGYAIKFAIKINLVL